MFFPTDCSCLCLFQLNSIWPAQRFCGTKTCEKCHYYGFWINRTGSPYVSTAMAWLSRLADVRERERDSHRNSSLLKELELVRGEKKNRKGKPVLNKWKYSPHTWKYSLPSHINFQSRVNSWNSRKLHRMVVPPRAVLPHTRTTSPAVSDHYSNRETGKTTHKWNWTPIDFSVQVENTL